ncbi:TMV resistance protein N-like protein [Tanacetum coccineum]
MAASSPHDHTYHIFLSFRGSDTRKTFTDHLYTALTNSGFHTFRDNDAIHKGKSIQPELETAIKQSKIAVIVFSKHYASSKWCLNELLSIMARKTCDASYCVFPVFYDVDPTEVGNQKGRFKDAFDEFERKGEFSKEMICEWRNALKVVSKLTGKVMQDEANGSSCASMLEVDVDGKISWLTLEDHFGNMLTTVTPLKITTQRNTTWGATS